MICLDTKEEDMDSRTNLSVPSMAYMDGLSTVRT